MSSGSVRLSVVGLQDEYLSGDPDVTYFIKKFNRHTKFALETFDVPFNQTNVNFGSFVNVTIPRNGQLIRTVYVKLVLPALTSGGYTNGIGNAIIRYADLVIGGQVIERINGEYMQIFDDTFISDSQQPALTYTVGKTQSLNGLGPAIAQTPGVKPVYGFYPRTFIAQLPFYFARSEALAIPLCALTRSEVEVRIQFQTLENLIAGGFVQKNIESVSTQFPLTWTYPPKYVSNSYATGYTSNVQLVEDTDSYDDKLQSVTWLPSSQSFALVPTDSTSNVYYYDYNTQKFDYFSSGLLNLNLIGNITGIAQNSSGVTLIVNKGYLPSVPQVSTKDKAAIALNGPTSTFISLDDPVESRGSISYTGVASDGTNFLAIGSGTFNVASPILNTAISFSSPDFKATIVSGLSTSVTFVSVSWSLGLNAYVIGDSDGKMYTYTIGETSFINIPEVVGPYSAWSSKFKQVYNVSQVACSSSVISNAYASSTDGINWNFTEWPQPPLSIASSPNTNNFLTILDTITGTNKQNYSIGISNATTISSYPDYSNQFQASLPVEYVFLADEEVRYIQNAKVDYVITQLQMAATTVPAGVNILSGYRLNFINPVKEMFFVIQDSKVLETNDYWNYRNNSTEKDQLVSLQLQFNGEDMISPKVADALYLGKVQFMNNHTRIPNSLFYNYSFSIDPENYLPTGQVNMSRIMNQNIWLTLTDNPDSRNIRIYARSYNILRVQNGLAGVLFIDNVMSMPGN
jgi:hypothetical protein